jgi:CHAT domain-containing protein/tetratricopeptide (TPR) repeat protein
MRGLALVLAGTAALLGGSDAVAKETAAVAAARAIDRAADPTAAVAAWRRALPGLAGVARGRALWELAAAMVAASESEAALPVIAEAAPLLAAPPATDEDRARLATTEGNALAEVNRLDAADAALDRALAAWRRAAPGGSAGEADALMAKATIAYSRGKLDEAKATGDRSAALYTRLGTGDTVDRIGAWTNLSTIYLQARELEASERYAREALAMAARTLPEDHPVAIVAMTNWVAVLAAQNRRAESVPILLRIAAIRERRFGPDYPPLAITYNNLSRNLMFLKQAAQAEPYARRAVAIGEKTRDPADQSLAVFRDNLADILDDTGKRGEAAAVRRAALAGLGTANENRAMRIRRSLAVSLTQAGDAAGALPEWTAVAAWLAKNRPPENPDRLEAEASLALVEARLGRPQAAARLTATLALVERELFAAGDATRRASNVQSLLDHLLEAAWLVKDRPAGFRVAQLQALDETGRAVAAALARAQVTDGAGAALVRRRQDLLAERDRQAQAALRAYGKSEADHRAATAAVARIDGEVAAAETELARVVPAYAALSRFRPLDEAEVAARLKPGQALVMPAAVGTGAITFVLHGGRADWARSAAGVDLPQAVAALRGSLGVAGGVRGGAAPATGGFDAAAAHRLYRAVVPASLDPALKGARTWLLAPGGALTALPFATLVTQAPRPAAKPAWLIRKVALVALPGIADVNGARGSAAGEARFVGVGAPALAGSAAPGEVRSAFRGGTVDRSVLAGLAPLPQAEGELKRMQAALPALTPTLLTGAAATEAAVKATPLKGVALLAFATHGLLGGTVEPGSEPGLVLTPPAEPSAADDGLLSSSEIAALDLDVDWVVLSACDTAAGDSPGAPALSGLARAFLYAGARSLLVSHWAVRDDVAARLTVDTVSRAMKGEDRAQALRRAMLALIDDPAVPGAADPAVWAPFILVER